MVTLVQMGCQQQGSPSLTSSSKSVSTSSLQTTSRQTVDFNFNWKFALSTDQSPIDSAQTIDFDDSQWREVRLPHDWSIEAEYSQDKTAGATGYLPGGLGWYRKTFKTPNFNSGKTQILFDGIYNHSKVWINGKLLGERPYGYSAFYYDLTPYLNDEGKENVLAVYVDRSRYVDSRWYTGSGIYRNVKLITTSKIHIPIWGTYITTPEVTDKSATVNIVVDISSNYEQEKTTTLSIAIINRDNQVVAETRSTITLAGKETIKHNADLELSSPQLWDIALPNLYSAKVTISDDQSQLDQVDTNFGIRTFKNDPNTGFFLNGRSIKIKGVNLHHDCGLVGAAVPKNVWRQRLQTLKDAGVNTIRTAHNPASKEFLELTDEMGFLVQEEAFDEWDNPKNKRKNFNQEGEVDYITESYSAQFPIWAERDLKAMLLRDRNHASIVQWSIGNEIEWTYPEYPGSTGYWDNNSPNLNYYWNAPPFTPKESQKLFNSKKRTGAKLEETAAKLSKWIKELDTTRPVTANLVTPSVSHYTGYTDVLDVIGYSYRQSVYEYGHKHYPDKMIVGSENWVQWHEWEAVIDKPYIAGIMTWTGANYLGESNGDWPKKGSTSGMLDFAGFKKPSYHMMKTVWSDEAHVYMTTQRMSKSAYKLDDGNIIEREKESWKRNTWGWKPLNEHWNYADNELISVEVYTNQPAVELFLAGQSLGVRYLKDNEDKILKWAVPFSAGKLEAKSLSSNANDQLVTAGEPTSIVLTSDKSSLRANGYDVARVVAQLVDNKGNPVKHINKKVTFKTSDILKPLGVDNGWSENIQKHQHDSIVTYKGRALLLVQSKFKVGKTKILASADGLIDNTVTIETR